MYVMYRCSASATTLRQGEDGPTFITAANPDKHNHIPSIAKLKTDRAISEAVTKGVKNRTVKPRQLFSDITNKLARDGNLLCPISMVNMIQLTYF